MRWLARLLAWDGIMPLIVWAIPAILSQIVPNERAMVLFSAVMLPAVAVIIRFYVGKSMIDANACTRRFRQVQIACLCIGLFLLMMLDSLLITLLTLDLPAWGKPGEAALTIVMFFAIVYPPYLAFLAVAMYPGPIANPEMAIRDPK